MLIVVWGVAGYLAVRERRQRGEQAARSPGARAALAKSNGFLLTHATTILLLGTDTLDRRRPQRRPPRRLDHDRPHRPVAPPLAYLSIPRDLLVPVPGVGNTKINAAYQAGGAALAIRTVHDFTGIPIDHVVIVDFNSFKDLIDAEGGITIERPRADPLEPLRLPVQDAGALPDRGRAGGSRKGRST